MGSMSLFLAMGALFGAQGAATAYIVFYREYIHHFPDAHKAHIMALRGALTAFLFFLGSSAIAGFVFTRFVVPSGLSGP